MQEIKEINGLKFDLQGKSDDLVVNLVVRDNIYGLPDRLDGKKVIDIGAHIGSFSILCASKGAKVISFEPTDKTFALLNHNISLNNQNDNIATHRLALGKPGERKLHYDYESGDGNKIESDVLGDNAFYEKFPFQIVTAVSLDDIINKYGGGSCDLLKIDCEGAEFEIVDEIVNGLHKKIKTIVVELHEKTLGKEFITKLSKFYNFRCLDVHPPSIVSEWIFETSESNEVKFEHKEEKEEKNIEICMAVWKRTSRMNDICKMLKEQTVQNFNLNIWNNSGEQLNVNFPKDRLNIVNSKINTGPTGRFELVRTVKGDTIIFLDDDIQIEKDFVEYNYKWFKIYGEKSICGWYSKIFLQKDNYKVDFIHPPLGTVVDYIGTGGMILSKKLFDDNGILYNIPEKYKLTEDMYLAFVAKKNGYKLISVDKKCEQINDGLNFTAKLSKDHKTHVLIDLVKEGYKLERYA